MDEWGCAWYLNEMRWVVWDISFLTESMRSQTLKVWTRTGYDLVWGRHALIKEVFRKIRHWLMLTEKPRSLPHILNQCTGYNGHFSARRVIKLRFHDFSLRSGEMVWNETGMIESRHRYGRIDSDCGRADRRLQDHVHTTNLTGSADNVLNIYDMFSLFHSIVLEIYHLCIFWRKKRALPTSLYVHYPISLFPVLTLSINDPTTQRQCSSCLYRFRCVQTGWLC